MTDRKQDQALDVVSRMVRQSEPGSNNFLVVGAFASSTWYLDAVIEAALIHLSDDVQVNRTARAVYARDGRSFRIVSADMPAIRLAGIERRSIHFAPCAGEGLAGRLV